MRYYYKLTDEKFQSNNNTQWGEGITHKATGKGDTLCSSDVIHVYDHPLKAAMFNPIHANFQNPVLWTCHVKKIVANDTLKVGVKECTTIKRISLPKITTNQRVRFAILCALKVYNDKDFVTWAGNWLSGKNKTAEAAARAAWATGAAWAAWAAGAAWAAEAAGAAGAAGAARAAGAAAEAAWAAEATDIDFVALIKKVMKD